MAHLVRAIGLGVAVGLGRVLGLGSGLGLGLGLGLGSGLGLGFVARLLERFERRVERGPLREQAEQPARA